MKTNLEFASAKFPSEPGEDQQINPGRHGKKLADFLMASLSKQGFKVQKPTVEDWGWRVEIENAEFPLWIGCGNYDEFENGFLCFIEPAKPVLRKWLRKIDTRPVVEKLGAAIETALKSPEAAATRIRWWSESER